MTTAIQTQTQAGGREWGSWFLRSAGRFFTRFGRCAAKEASELGHWAVRSAGSIDRDLVAHLPHVPFMAATMFLPRHNRVVPLADDGHAPLIFIHGLGGRAGNFALMRTVFGALGRRRCYSFDYSRIHSLEELESQLVEYIDRIVAENGLRKGEQIDVVAHSMGGIAIRLAMTTPRIRKRMRRVVTLGTPHRGTHIARWAQSDYTKGLRPDSAMFERLHRSEKRARVKPKLTAFWSRKDIIVLPAENATHPDAENVEAPGFTHLTYLTNGRFAVNLFALLAE